MASTGAAPPPQLTSGGAAEVRGPVVVTGDVVTSRRYLDTAQLLAGLDAALATVEAAGDSLLALRRTDRDVFLGAYADIGAAAAAALRLRLGTDGLVLTTRSGTREAVELRLGIGLGPPAPGDPEGPAPTPRSTAGPDTPELATATSLARAALAEAEELPASRRWPASLRSRCRADDPVLEGAINAHLLLQDQLLARLDARDRRALMGLLDGERQVDVAAALGVSQPAIARRIRVRGSLALHRALLELQGASRTPASGADGL